MLNRKWCGLVAVIAVLLLVALGCGQEAAPASPAASPTAVSREPIRIGVITSLTGRGSVLGVFVKNTLDLMARRLNDQGGINGRPVELVYGDDRSEPSQALIEYRRLRDSGITALVGPVLSSSCVAIVDEVERDRVPMVTTCATHSQVQPVRNYVFMSTFNNPAMAQQLARFLKESGYSRVGLLAANDEFGQNGLQSFRDAARQQSLQVTDETFQVTATTFVPQLTAMQNAGVEAVLVWASGTPLVTISKEAKQLGLRAPLVLTAAGASPLYLQPAADAAEGVIMASSAGNVLEAVPASNPIRAVVEGLATAYRAAYNEAPSQFTWDACGAFLILTTAIKEAGTDPQKVRDYIESRPIVGCHGTYRYSSSNHAGLGPEAVWIARVQGGRLVATDFSLRQGQR
jgi:branched-chain amino acid transport system substrate-binding protein